MSPIKMNRRTALKSIAGASGIALGSLGSVPSLAVEKTSKVRAAKNLVLIVNVLGYNKRTFYPPGDDLDKSPLLSRLSKHHGRLTMFRGMRQPSIIGGHGGDKGMLTCNYNQPNTSVSINSSANALNSTRVSRLSTWAIKVWSGARTAGR